MVMEETVSPESSLFVLVNILEEVQDALVGGLAGDDFIRAVGDGDDSGEASNVAICPLAGGREEVGDGGVGRVDGFCSPSDDHDVVEDLVG